jgi:hypothetical protein
MSEFPPVPKHARDIAILLGLYETVCPEGTAWYVSTPITTGQRKTRWQSVLGMDESHPDFKIALLEHVVTPNIEDAAKVVEDLRIDHSLVINPSAMKDVPGWVQSDYRAFWGEVITRFVQTVVFMDGWEYSSGCCYEFLVATKFNIVTLAQDLTPLTREAGIRMVRETVEAGDPDAPFRHAILAELQS